MNSYHVGRQKINRLSQHAGFGFNAANSPADDAQAINHGRMRVSADEGIRIINIPCVQNAFG